MILLTDPPLHVRRYDCDDRFLVRAQVRRRCEVIELETEQSRKEAEVYLVDQSENYCSCSDRHFRPKKTGCKHKDHVNLVVSLAKRICQEIGIPFDARQIGSGEILQTKPTKNHERRK